MGGNKFITTVFDISNFEKHDGSLGCGCPNGPEPMASREEIEADMKTWMAEQDISQPGWDNGEYNKSAGEYYKRLRTALAQGRSVCDEDGIILPEFEYVR